MQPNCLFNLCLVVSQLIYFGFLSTWSYWNSWQKNQERIHFSSPSKLVLLFQIKQLILPHASVCHTSRGVRTGVMRTDAKPLTLRRRPFSSPDAQAKLPSSSSGEMPGYTGEMPGYTLLCKQCFFTAKFTYMNLTPTVGQVWILCVGVKCQVYHIPGSQWWWSPPAWWFLIARGLSSN